MKRIKIIALACLASGAAWAQTALDAYQISQNDLKGTARFMSMGGAFGALGGDLSTLNQNPGGIGIYRSSEVGLTLDFNFQATSTPATGIINPKMSQTKVYCNNFGYIGAVPLNNDVMPYFQFGASYSRAVSFDRLYQGGFDYLRGSLTNYVGAYTTADGWTTANLDAYDSKYNPYQDSFAPWMSILMYNNYLINNYGGEKGFEGLYDGVAGYGDFTVREKGHVDEYSLNLGGNISNSVYWGLGFGIVDLNYTQDVWYSETFDQARIPSSQNAHIATTGQGGYELASWKRIHGTGVNFKVGVIVKPINELRIGLAVHTPTYYSFTQEGYASVDYDLASGYYPVDETKFATETDYGYNDYFLWNARSPWRLIASAAGVVQGRFILSADYEYRPYQSMNVADQHNNDYQYMCDDVATYYQASNIIRLGGEYRLTPQVSLRAGYSYQSTPVTVAASENYTAIYTSGPDDTETTPSYSLDKSTQYITCGLGYRYKGFYVDAAYVHKYRQSTFHGFTAVDSNGLATGAPQVDVTDHNNSIVLSLGFKF